MRDVYVRKCRTIRVVDGDTVHFEIDLGYKVKITPDNGIRLLGIDTSELKAKDPKEKERAKQAKVFTQNWLDAAVSDCDDEFPLTIRSEKNDSFDRWLGEIYCPKGNCLNKALLTAGLARVYKR